MRKILSLMLAITMLCTMVMPMQTVYAANTDILYETSTTWFPINESTGGNAKYFLEKGAYGLNVGDEFADFIPMVDFGGISKRYSADAATAEGYTSGVGYYPTGTDTVVTGQLGALGYTIDAGTDNTKQQKYVDLTTKNGLTYWNINGKDYHIDTTGKVIKILSNVHTDLITDEAVKARFETLKGVTFDVTDGYYYNVGFLVSMSSNSSRNFKYKLVYEDGTTSTLTSPAIKDENYSNNASKYAAYGYIYRQMINPTQATMSQAGTTSAGGNSRYLPVVVDTDVSKKLTAIEIIANTDWEVLYIVSSWGEKPSIKAQLENVTEAKNLTEENYIKAQEELAKFMEYVEACGLTYEDLDAEMKAKVDAINNPFPQIMANLIAIIDENAEITAENIYTYKDALAEIETYREEKGLTFTTEQETKINKVKANIEAVEQEIIVTDVNKKIAELPPADTVNAENFEEVSLKVQEIKKIIEEYGIADEDITSENTEALAALQAKLDIVILGISKVVPLDIQKGANTKLFLEENETDPDYREWSDYIVGTYHSTIAAGTVWAPGVLRYSETKEEKGELISAPNKIWTINGIPYRIGSDVKGIRLHGEKKADWSDEVTKILTSYTSATINLEKGYYDTLYLAASNHCGSTTSTTYDPEAEMLYVLTYKDGSTTEGKLQISVIPETPGNKPSTGYVVRSGLEPGEKGSYIKFANYEIDADPTKQVASLKLTCTEKSRVIFVVGVSGKTAPVGTIKEAIKDRLTYSAESFGTATKSTLLEIEQLVKQYKAVGGDVSTFEGIERFEADITELKARLIDYAEHKNDVDFENTYFEQVFTKDIAVDGDKITVLKNSVPLATDAYSLVAEGNKLTVIIPDDHSKDAAYKIVMNEKSILNKDNSNFYVDTVKIVEFKGVKPIEITKFALEEGTINVNVSNNMKANKQKYLLIIAAYDKDNKLVGVRELKGELAEEQSIEAALDASTFENGTVVECYLADTIDNLKYLDTAASITIAK